MDLRPHHNQLHELRLAHCTCQCGLLCPHYSLFGTIGGVSNPAPKGVLWLPLVYDDRGAIQLEKLTRQVKSNVSSDVGSWHLLALLDIPTFDSVPLEVSPRFALLNVPLPDRRHWKIEVETGRGPIELAYKRFERSTQTVRTFWRVGLLEEFRS